MEDNKSKEHSRGISRKSVFILAFLCALTINAASAYIYFTKGAPERLPPDVVRFANGQNDINPRRSECHNMTLKDLEETKGCVLGTALQDQPKISFFSYGDSFADTLAPELEELSARNNIKGYYASYSSCPPVFDIQRINKVDNPTSYHCREFNNIIKELIHKNRIRNVIWFARWNGYVTEYLVADDDKTPKNITESIEILKKHIYQSAKYFRDNKINLYIINQPPEYSENIPGILAKAALTHQSSKNLGLSQEDYNSQKSLIDALFTSIKDMPYVHIIDISDLFCLKEEKHCKIDHNGYSLYRDNNHLSIQGAYYLTPKLETMFSNMKEK